MALLKVLDGLYYDDSTHYFYLDEEKNAPAMWQGKGKYPTHRYLTDNQVRILNAIISTDKSSLKPDEIGKIAKVSANNVANQVGEIRKKFELEVVPPKGELIETIYNDGYRLNPAYRDIFPCPEPKTTQDTPAEFESFTEQQSEAKPKSSILARINRWGIHNIGYLSLGTLVLLVVGIFACIAFDKIDGTAASNNAPAVEVPVSEAPDLTEIRFKPGRDWMELIIGTSQEIGIDISPDNADINTVEALPDDDTVATVENLWVTATDVWDENAPHQTNITIRGGRSKSLTLPVYVRNRIYHPGTALGSNDVEGGGEHE